MRLMLSLSAPLLLCSFMAPLFNTHDGLKKGGESAPDSLSTPQLHANRKATGELQQLAATPHRPNDIGREQIACRFVVRKLLMENYDLNHDGKLDEHELAKLKRDARIKQEKLACHLLSADNANGGGKLQATESRRLSLFLACKPANKVEPATAQITATQQHASLTGEPGLRQKAAAPATADGALPRASDLPRTSIPVAFMAQHLIIETYDTNANGKLDPPEICKIKADGMLLYRSREQALIAQFDLNDDGRLSLKEWKIAIALCEHDRRFARAMQYAGAWDERFPESCYDFEIILNLCREYGIDVEVRVDQQGDFRVKLISADDYESVSLP